MKILASKFLNGIFYFFVTYKLLHCCIFFSSMKEFSFRHRLNGDSVNVKVVACLKPQKVIKVTLQVIQKQQELLTA